MNISSGINMFWQCVVNYLAGRKSPYLKGQLMSDVGSPADGVAYKPAMEVKAEALNVSAGQRGHRPLDAIQTDLESAFKAHTNNQSAIAAHKAAVDALQAADATVVSNVSFLAAELADAVKEAEAGIALATAGAKSLLLRCRL